MTQYEDITQLLGDSAESIDPLSGVSEMMPMLTVGLLVIASVVVLAFVFMVISRFRSYRATVQMQKDIKDIREQLERQQAQTQAPVELKDDSQQSNRPQ